MNKFAKMLERMEDLILAGVAIPLTPWTIIHGDKLVPLLDRIRESLPDEIRKANQIVEHRDQLLDEAQRKARQMIEDAKAQADVILCESELMKAVHAEAERIRHTVISELDGVRRKAYEEAEAVRAKAQEDARFTVENADRYAETILGALDKNLTEFHGAVRNGQKQISRMKSEMVVAHNAAMGKHVSTAGRFSYEPVPQSPTKGVTHHPDTAKILDALKQAPMEVR